MRYEDFGAVGDGKTNDHPAIIKAHEHANSKGLPVKAKEGATYYLGGEENNTAILQTNTDWRGAKFIVDDTKVTDRKISVFMITNPPSLKSFAIEGVKSLKKNQTRIDASLPQDCMIDI